MDFKNKITELTSEIKTLEDESANLQAKSFELRQERELLIAKMILEDKLLKDTKWHLTLNGGDGLILNYTMPTIAGGIDGSMQFLVDLARKDYHSWFELISGITLRFDDNDISITFKESKQALPFIRKHGLIVDASTITDRLSKLKRDAAALEAIYHQFSSIL